ncbi:phage antirepressor KilAC domain-containing protein [Companilactobacillus farciminis]|uniref:phage antirepressor KilAC domain-containing protein n=1 Tax=Companilactobacillus farciminis TaxID=1612 RepID=UPI00232F9B8C|nr:phage antirepressor KilAC domain-containing protein [Companilactobacillus farciminis]WCG36299.1 antA/AntB antirepressor family protein [Companilactobacillus farciminis]
MMNELIPTEKDKQGNILVSGRDLHKFLEIGKDFSNWFKDMIKYGFEEGKDFTPFLAKSHGGRPRTEYAMTLDMAKEISMIQRNEKGKQARQYFIKVEEAYKHEKQLGYSTKNVGGYQVPDDYRGALLLAADLQEQVDTMKPKASYYDQLIANKSLMVTTAIAKDYGMSAKEFNKVLHKLKVQYKLGGQWFLYSKYHNRGWTSSATRIVDGTPRITTKWTQKGRVGLYRLLKKHDIVPMIEKLDIRTVVIGGTQ